MKVQKNKKKVVNTKNLSDFFFFFIYNLHFRLQIKWWKNYLWEPKALVVQLPL